MRFQLPGHRNTSFRCAESVSETCSRHAFHVDHNPALERWDIVDEVGRVIGHRDDRGKASPLLLIFANGRNTTAPRSVDAPISGQKPPP
jgi:hypothetical protein